MFTLDGFNVAEPQGAESIPHGLSAPLPWRRGESETGFGLSRERVAGEVTGEASGFLNQAVIAETLQDVATALPVEEEVLDDLSDRDTVEADVPENPLVPQFHLPELVRELALLAVVVKLLELPLGIATGELDREVSPALSDDGVRELRVTPPSLLVEGGLRDPSLGSPWIGSTNGQIYLREPDIMAGLARAGCPPSVTAETVPGFDRSDYGGDWPEWRDPSALAAVGNRTQFWEGFPGSPSEDGLLRKAHWASKKS